MASTSIPEWQQSIANKLATALSLPAPNQLLTSRVISLARTLPSEATFFNAAKSFGKFPEDFLRDLRNTVQSHGDEVVLPASNAQGSGNGIGWNEANKKLDESQGETLAPEEPRRAGLNTSGSSVSIEGAERVV